VGPGEIELKHEAPGVAVITFSGEHDLNTVPALKSRLDNAIEHGGLVVVDLSGATFIDSSILGAVLDARREAAERDVGFEIALSNGAHSVERVLEVTGLRSALPVHSSRDDALQAARSSRNGQHGQ
jgi:anti-sigma B factor antagonist